MAAGDEIVTIGGRDAAKLEPYARAFALGSGSAGATITVELRRGAEERTLSLETRDLL